MLSLVRLRSEGDSVGVFTDRGKRDDKTGDTGANTGPSKPTNLSAASITAAVTAVIITGNGSRNVRARRGAVGRRGDVVRGSDRRLRSVRIVDLKPVGTEDKIDGITAFVARLGVLSEDFRRDGTEVPRRSLLGGDEIGSGLEIVDRHGFAFGGVDGILSNLVAVKIHDGVVDVLRRRDAGRGTREETNLVRLRDGDERKNSDADDRSDNLFHGFTQSFKIPMRYTLLAEQVRRKRLPPTFQTILTRPQKKSTL